MVPSNHPIPATNAQGLASDGLAEIGLILPRRQVRALIDLSRRRGQSVGEILRDLIRDEIAQVATGEESGDHAA